MARVCLVATAIFTLLSAPSSAAAAAPYEPNDSIISAAGPLEAGQSYGAAIETAGDRDYYSFYVTSPTSTEVSLTVQNLGGGSNVSGINAAILDAMATPIAAQTFIHDGESRIVSAQLEPQKYFVEVSPSEGVGDSYLLSPGGDSGSFGPYSQISSRCAAALSASARAGRRLSRARSKLQRTTARLRRSHYAGRAAKRPQHREPPSTS